MGSRRLDISSLLCPDQPPAHDNPTSHSQIVQDPVVLAPHLRNPALAAPSRDPLPPRRPPSPPSALPPVPSARRRTYSDLSSHDADIPRPHPELPRTHPAPRSIDNLIHPPSHPPLRQPPPPPPHQHQHQQQPQQDPSYTPSQPRPSSSASLPARSPAGGYTYPAIHSPTLSPLAQISGLPSHPPHPGCTSPSQQRSSSSPFYQPSQASPLLHRPPSSHSQLSQSQPRHASVSHRSRSNTTTSASPTAKLYPLPSPQISPPSQNKMAFAGLEALVHAATEERKRLSAGTPVDHSPAIDRHSPILPPHQRHPPSRSPEGAYRMPQSITSPSLTHQREYPAILPTSHVSRHRTVIQNDDPRPADDYHSRPSSSPYSRPPPISRQQYEEEQRQYLIAQQERERGIQLVEQRRLEQQHKEQKKIELQRLEDRRILEQQWEQRHREDGYREKRLQERMLEEQEEMERQRLLEQQRIESKRLQAQQLMVERQMQERQREQQRLQEEQERRRVEQQLQEQRHLQELERQRKEEEMEIRHREEKRREEERRRLEQERMRGEMLAEEEHRRLYEERLFAEGRRREEERQLEELRLREERQMEERRRREEERHMEELRRREEERRMEEQRRREEERRMEEQRRREEERRMEEQRRREEERRIEELKREEERRIGELRREEERMIVEQRRREEERREEEQRLRLQREEHERLQERLRAEREAQERLALLRQQEARVSADEPRPAHGDAHRFPSGPNSSNPVAPQSAPAVIELPQPIRPYPHITGPRKSDPIQIKRPADHDPPSLHISTSAPSSSTDDQRPSKKQRYSESPPTSSVESSYPRVVALPPPISTDYLPPRPGSSGVRRPGSGQGRRQGHVGLGDAVEREKEKERERERIPGDGHRIISPLGRRSPPGSQIGRATAAKKSDEARRADEAAAAAAIADVRKREEVHPQMKKPGDETQPSVSPVRVESRRISQEHTAPVSKTEESAVRKSTDDSSRRMSLDAVMTDQTDVAVVKKESPQSTSLDPPSQIKEQSQKDAAPRLPRDDRTKPVTSQQSDSNRIAIDSQNLPKKPRDIKGDTEASTHQPQQEDPHEWFIDHYAHSPSTSQFPLEPPRSRSPSISPVLSKPQPEGSAGTLPVEIPKPVIALRSVSPDADAALERELAELMAEEDELPVHKHEPDDMDIDLAVAETLEEGEKSKIVPMDVDEQDDVEDELLSLVDDRPPPPTGRKVGTPTIPAPPSKPPSSKAGADESKRPSPPASALSTTSPVATSPVIRPASTFPGSDRGSMPPPSAALRGKEKEEEVSKKGDSNGAVSAQAAKKRKDPGSKVAAKAKATATTSTNAQTTISNNKQQKAKATATKKAKAADAAPSSTAPIPTATAETKAAVKHAKTLTSTHKKSTAANHVAGSRSRSASVMPAGSADPEPERKSEEKDEEEKEEAVDDKLYCVCKTKYDEDRFMIACDRCDEWYHTTCVDMPDLEVELVDQFFCPPCIEQNPHLNLKTTYKQRCLNGLRHPDPDSPKACHKPARGAISKYCSDECGVKYMQSRIDAWAKKGGKKEELWESVKHAEKREGIAVCVDEKIKSELDKRKKKQTKVDRETERLQGLLNQVVKMREEIKNSMEVLVWREQLLQLASERAEHIDQCGWDQRLCFGDEEWQEFGAGVLESYDDDVKGVKDENGMQVEDREEEGEWWCPGQKSCKRHNGWQTLRYKDICKEREKKEELLARLTTRERQLRKRIEDLIDPSGRKPNDSTSQVPLKSSNAKLPNGHAKSKGTTETLKKGKKRKAPAS